MSFASNVTRKIGAYGPRNYVFDVQWLNTATDVGGTGTLRTVPASDTTIAYWVVPENCQIEQAFLGMAAQGNSDDTFTVSIKRGSTVLLALQTAAQTAAQVVSSASNLGLLLSKGEALTITVKSGNTNDTGDGACLTLVCRPLDLED